MEDISKPAIESNLVGESNQAEAMASIRSDIGAKRSALSTTEEAIVGAAIMLPLIALSSGAAEAQTLTADGGFDFGGDLGDLSDCLDCQADKIDAADYSDPADQFDSPASCGGSCGSCGGCGGGDYGC
jgi:hypothetical protein